MKKIFLFFFALSLAACGRSPSAPVAAESASAKLRQLSTADVDVARPATLAATLPLTATLSALRQSDVAAEVDGVAREVAVREGERVAAGALLARLDSEVLAQSVSEQEAQLANQSARLALARTKLAKQRELYQQGFISKLALDELESDFKVNEGQLRAQQAQLARARKSLADAVVRAPIAGVVYARLVNPGELVARNKKLFAIADLSELEATASVPSRLAPQLRVGQEVRFSAEGLDGQFRGRVARVNPVANPGTRSFNVYVRVDNRDGRLKAGQFVQGNVVLAEQAGVISVPDTALQDAQGKPWVMVVEQGVLRRRDVVPGLRADAERRVAVSGLRAGDVYLRATLLGSKVGERVALPRP